MATKSKATKIEARLRTPEGSRATRRLRRSGRVPGVLYGGGEDPVAFDVDALELRHALAASGAVLDVALDGASASAVVKSAQHHPVRGETIHLDLLRVRLDVAIHALVAVELTGIDEAPGVKEGGVLEQITRELNIEALPNEIPESIQLDVSGMQINDTLTLSAITPPAGVTLLEEHPDEVVVATLTPPRLETESEDDIETETQRVGEGGEPAAEAEGATGDEAPAAEPSGDSSE